MEKSVLKMLGTLMCALSACAVVVPVQDFDLQKVSGKGIRYNNDVIFQEVNIMFKIRDNTLLECSGTYSVV